MCLSTGLASGKRLDPGSGPLAERQPGPAEPRGSAPRGSAEDECSGTAGTVCKFGQAGLTGLKWKWMWKSR